MQTISTLLITYIANSVWITCLITVAAALASRLTGRFSFGQRHALWVAALICSSVLPFTTLWNTFSEAGDAGAHAVTLLDESATEADASGMNSQHSFWIKVRRPLPPILFAPLVTGVVTIAYLGVVGRRAWRLVSSLRHTRNILRRASRCWLPLQGPLLNKCASALKRQRVFLVCSRDVAAPSAIGLRQPVLVLPPWFIRTCSEEEIASALCHELAHVQRHDFFLNVIYELLLLPIAFHPAAWFIKKRIEQTRELACDRIAAAQISTPTAYARSLLNIAQYVARHSGAANLGHALGLFDKNSLEERIMNLLNKEDVVAKKHGTIRLAFAGCLFAITCVMASVMSIQVAMAAQSADGPRFDGTWQGKFKGKTFVTVRLISKDGKLSGTISKITLQMDANGNLTDASAQDGEDEIAETTPQGNSLHLATKAKGQVETASGETEESVQYDMTLTAANEAQLQIASAPPGMPAPKPWNVQRTPDAK